jgi:hypothetical protein
VETGFRAGEENAWLAIDAARLRRRRGLRVTRGKFSGRHRLQRKERGGGRQCDRKLHATSAPYSGSKLRLAEPGRNPYIAG